jgi:hypothetical protein
MYLKYLSYVLRHKWFVFLACCKLGVPWLGVLHDLSKFRPDEFVPYARYFYGPKPESGYGIEQVKSWFDRAWLLHIHRNRHHPQFWVLRNDTDGVSLLEMPEKYVREMVADWIGAGMAIHGYGWDAAPQKTLDWWAENHNRSGYAMHDETFRRVGALLVGLR